MTNPNTNNRERGKKSSRSVRLALAGASLVVIAGCERQPVAGPTGSVQPCPPVLDKNGMPLPTPAGQSCYSSSSTSSNRYYPIYGGRSYAGSRGYRYGASDAPDGSSSTASRLTPGVNSTKPKTATTARSSPTSRGGFGSFFRGGS